jgi:N-acetylglucosamine-6-phosphate deacetylase
VTERRQLWGRAFIGGSIDADTLVTLDGKIIADVRRVAAPPAWAERFEGVLVPGFIDVHVHGGYGADFMDAHDEANERIVAFHARHGTTALAATTLSSHPHELHAAVASIADVSRTMPDGAEICGIHLEGPYINRAKAGAQNLDAIRKPHTDEIAALLAEAPRMRWIATVAPEVEGVTELMRHFRDRILFSIGHTAATWAESAVALEEGARHFTHLFNAMTPLGHREPGVVGSALSSTEATAELIADGIHVHPTVLRIAALSLPGRIALITDAMRACGLADGEYKLLDYEVVVTEGAARLRDGTLAGSVLTMDRAVANMVELAGLPIEVVLPLATSVPAKILCVEHRKGAIRPGYDADLVLLNEKLEVTRVFARGSELA